MKKIFILMLAAATMLAVSCYKDKGNYDYNVPEAPVVKNIDSLYSVFVGDSLKVLPVITFSNKAKLAYEWKISAGAFGDPVVYNTPELKMVYGIGAGTFTGRFTITDSTIGMKYFYDFLVEGKTPFSTGTTVLSDDAGKSRLSFVKPDGSVIKDVFELVNGKSLPDGPLQVIPMIHQYINNGMVLGYWITAAQGNGGSMVDPSTFKELRSLKDNFFSPPVTVKPGFLVSTANGVPDGIINGKLNTGASQTAYFSPIYGFFGVAAEGDYEAYRKCLVNPAFPFYFGYDINRKQFIGFTNFGSSSYIGTNYQVAGVAAFDPKNVGLDLLDIEQVNPTDGYAFGKGSDGIVYELKYSMAFPGTIQITSNYKRPFIQQSLITASTKWQATAAQIFYLTSGDKVYRYNPLSDDIRPLVADFQGKAISMIKLTNGGNTLLAGVNGSLYYLDVSVGKSGEILKKIDGIPGSPVDVAGN